MASLRLSALAVLLLVLATLRAAAHPHVFVDAKTELVFDQTGRMSAIRNIWQFDKAFTAYAVEGLDADGDGKLSDAELKPLADINVKSLKEFEFFTYLTLGRDEAKFLPPKEYWLEFHGGRLTLFFTLPLEKPMVAGRHTMLEIFDPEYFVAFTFIKEDPIRLVNAPKGCTTLYQPPHDLDTSTMAILAAIPVDQHDLPPDLRQAASVLAHHITISCPVAKGGAVIGAAPAATDASADGTRSPTAIGDAPAAAAALPSIRSAAGDGGSAAAGPDASGAAAAAEEPATPAGSGDKPGGPAGAEAAPAAPAAMQSVATANAPDAASPPRPRDRAPSAALAGGAAEGPAPSGSAFSLVGLLLFLLALAGGAFVLVLQRRPVRSR